MKRLLNRSEEATYNEIIRVDGLSSKIFSKIRIADVLPIENSGISSDLFSFSLKAHFDFVIVDDNLTPVFAIEFDGPTHQTSIQQDRDSKKIALCEHFNFPILRINDKYIERTYRGKFSLLTWIVDVYFMQEAFNEAQRNGQIREDEGFDPMWIVSSGSKVTWPYQLGLDARVKLESYKKNGLIYENSSNGAVGYCKSGPMRGFEFIRITENDCIYVESGMKNYKFPVLLSDLFDEILTVALESKVTEYLKNGTGLISLKAAQERALQLDQTVTWGHGHSAGGLNPINLFKR